MLTREEIAARLDGIQYVNDNDLIALVQKMLVDAFPTPTFLVTRNGDGTLNFRLHGDDVVSMKDVPAGRARDAFVYMVRILSARMKRTTEPTDA